MPASAPLPELETIRFTAWGTAVAAYPYRDPGGALAFAVLRFERRDEHGHLEKQLLPYTCGHREWTTRDGRRRDVTGWHFKRPMLPLPIYGWDRLTALSGLVCVCEGEKAADAAAALWPDVACIASQGGSKAAKKTGWGPIEGRDVAIWPDNDKPGAAYAVDVAELCRTAGARSVRVVPIDPSWPAGWDLADKRPEGVSDDMLRNLLEREPPAPTDEEVAAWRDAEIERLSRLDAISYAAERKRADQALRIGLANLDKAVQAKRRARLEERKAEFRQQDAPAPGEVRWPFGYEVRADGLHYDPGGENPELWVCDRLEVLGEGRDAEGEGWAIWLRWNDADGREHTWPLPKRLLTVTTGELEGSLLDRGLRMNVDPAARKALKEALAGAQSGSRVTLVDRPGWQAMENGGSVFVMPDGEVIGEATEQVVLRLVAESGAASVRTAGTLEGWQDEVARLADGNPVPMFIMCSAFVGPLIGPLQQQSGGVHLQGRSKLGKTLIARAAVSAWGHTRKGGLHRDWRSTTNALEASAEESTGSMLFLDEIHQAEPKEVVNAVYMLGNESGKGRMTRETVSRRRKQWQTVVVSTGEADVATMAAKAGAILPAGGEVRVPSISVTSIGAMWKDLHDHADPQSLMGALHAALGRHHGIAIRTFLAELVERWNADPDGITELFERSHRALMNELEDGADVQVHDVTRRFALFAAAGEMAIAWGVLPWAPGEAERAAIAVLKLWLGRRGSQKASEDNLHLRAIRTFLVQHGASRFVGLYRPGGVGSPAWDLIDPQRPVINSAGFRRRQDDNRFEYLIDRDIWPKICAEADVEPTDCARTLLAAGFLAAGDGKNLPKKHAVPGVGKQRYFTILPGLVGDQGEREPPPADIWPEEGMPDFSR